MWYTFYNNNGEFDGRVEVKNGSLPPRKGWAPYVVEGKYSSFSKFIDSEVIEMESDVLTQERAIIVRRQRDDLLLKSDFSQLPNAPVEDAEVWEEYRTKLRELPEQSGFPHEVEWPKKPK